MSRKQIYPYQKLVARYLLDGQSVILQAPTGAGKTDAALLPFFYGWSYLSAENFPRQCIYSVPMRVLVNQFYTTYSKTAYQHIPDKDFHIVVQTGENAADRQFEGDLIFTTIDQTLSNFLHIPYAVSAGKANLNAGAVLSSYLVFDEFHLFPYDEKEKSGAFAVTIQMLERLRKITPFVLMTATFSNHLLHHLQARLQAEVVTVSDKEAQIINTRWGKFEIRQRIFALHNEALLDADAVKQHHQSRSVAICNTVNRARQLFEMLQSSNCRAIPFDDVSLEPFYEQLAIRSDSEVIEETLLQVRQVIENTPNWQSIHWAILLHARFEKAHRLIKEKFVQELFAAVDKRTWLLPSLILVATQVVEVGVNITSQTLHTEIAPANSILQRAGRCARFPTEHGVVHVYNVPLNEKTGKPQHLPYQSDLCEQTWDALEKWDQRVVDFAAEQEIINDAHGAHDKQMLADLNSVQSALLGMMQRAIFNNDKDVRPKLIRNVDNCPLLICIPPKLTYVSPHRLVAFSLYRGSLMGQHKQLHEWADAHHLDWVFKRVVPRIDEEDRSIPVTYEWSDISNDPTIAHQEIAAALFIAVNPELIAYDAVWGLRFVSPDHPDAGRYKIAWPEEEVEQREKTQFNYRLESYTHHIQIMTRIYEQENWLDKLRYIGRTLYEKKIIPKGMLDQAVRLAIALHDVGKLQVEWQTWARIYQSHKKVSGAIPEYLIAHTLSESDEHRTIAKNIEPRRPHHAGEGALASLNLIKSAIHQHEPLQKAIFSAIVRHHSPQAHTIQHIDRALRYESHTAETIQQALEVAGCEWNSADLFVTHLPVHHIHKYSDLKDFLISNHWDADDWLLYTLIVRIVRLTDGKSQEYHW